jgi:sigma-B regulation protein RsbU (phosphoserine phosphatase)
VKDSVSRDERNSRFELKTVLETSRMLIESRETEFVLNNLILIVMGKLLSGKAAILLQNTYDDHYTISKAKGLKKSKEGDVFTINLDNKLNQGSYISYDEHPELLPRLSEKMEGSLFFNLRTSNLHLGYLFLAPKANNQPYEEHELEFVESLCIISSVALTNSQLFDELKRTNRKLDRRIHELNTLFDLSKEFNLLVDREKIARIFKFALLGQLFVRTFFLLYKSDEHPSLLASNGMTTLPDEKEMEQLFELVPADVLVVDESLNSEHQFLNENDISALIGISVQNEKVAIIGVGNRVNGEKFAETDFNFLKSLANLAVISIQKTYFLEERIDKERMEEELSIAKSIQQGLLPDPVPEINGIDLAARTISSREVGGDYFDIAPTPDGNNIFAIADVTGKGVPAALLMANLQSMLHVLLPVDITLSEATDRINSLIFKNTPSDKFITFFWGKYMTGINIFSYVNAGHNPPLLLRKDESEFEELNEGGLLLGALESFAPYVQKDIQLYSGDLMVMYTDGVNEAYQEITDEEFGEERLKESILRNRDKSSGQILENIIKDVRVFSKNRLIDDLTLLVVKVL